MEKRKTDEPEKVKRPSSRKKMPTKNTTLPHWEPVPNIYDPVNRRYHASVMFHSAVIVVLGGKSGDKILDDMVYMQIGNLEDGALPQITLPMKGRYGHVACVMDMFIVMYGGHTEEKVTNEVFVWQLKPSTPISVEPFPLVIEGEGPCRVHHTAHLYNKNLCMYVFCGQDENGRDSNQVWKLTLGNALRWELCDVPDPKPRARSGHCSVMTADGKVYMFGGFCEETGEYLNDMWMFNIEKLRWKEQTPLIEGRQRGYPSGIANAAAQENEGKIYIFGGQDDTRKYFDDLWVYDIKERTYRLAVTENPPPQKVYHSAHLLGNDLVIWGGERYPEAEKTEMVHLNLCDLVFDEDGDVEKEEEDYTAKKKKEKKDDTYKGETKKDRKDSKELKDKKVSKNVYLEEEKIDGEIIQNESGNDICRKLYNDKTLEDVVFQVEGQEFSGHRCILSASCKYFESLLNSISGRQGNKGNKSEVIQIQDLKASTFKALLEFIYCVPFSFNQQLFLDLLQFSVKWQYSELQSVCENVLTRSLTEDNFLLIVKETDNLPTQRLQQGIIKFIAANVERISQRNDLESLPKTLLLQVLSQVKPKTASVNSSGNKKGK